MLYKLKKKLAAIYNKKKRTSYYQPISEIKIGFVCGFHGKTGAPVAIANIANGLAQTFNVSFEEYPNSFYYSLLDKSVQLEKKIEDDKDIYIYDLRADVDEVRKRKYANKIVIVTIHGLKPPSDSLADNHINQMLSLADNVHFVGNVQQDSYQLPKRQYFIIPNGVKPVKKSEITNNIGVVGNLNKCKKNAPLSIKIGLESKCDQIHLWSTNKSYSQDRRVVTHNWENNRDTIYNSFDVLVFLSQQETFGLVVAEALSAGIPCILSDLQAFLPFKECPGVILVKSNDINEAHLHVNRLLAQKVNLRNQIIEFYQQHFSLDKINRLWCSKVLELIEKSRVT